MSISPLERRRRQQGAGSAALRYAINDDQRDALYTLERFGWSLKFVRHDAGSEPMAWVYDPDRKCLAVIEPDGKLVEGRVPPHRD